MQLYTGSTLGLVLEIDSGMRGVEKDYAGRLQSASELEQWEENRANTPNRNIFHRI